MYRLGGLRGLRMPGLGLLQTAIMIDLHQVRKCKINMQFVRHSRVLQLLCHGCLCNTAPCFCFFMLFVFDTLLLSTSVICFLLLQLGCCTYTCSGPTAPSCCGIWSIQYPGTGLAGTRTGPRIHRCKNIFCSSIFLSMNVNVACQS